MWQQLFEDEKEKIKQALDNITPRIEHIGSTAIPGIYAKPVIDILIGVPTLSRFTDVDINCTLVYPLLAVTALNQR